MPPNVRLDPKTEGVVKREAAHPSEPASAWEAMQHLVGVANSGEGRLSEDTGEQFRALVQKKARSAQLAVARERRRAEMSGAKL